jgi:hypothetical protein
MTQRNDPHPVWGFLKLLAGALIGFIGFWLFVVVVFSMGG